MFRQRNIMKDETVMNKEGANFFVERYIKGKEWMESTSRRI
jgi:hypothetical protein